jgi:hypothetical protein
VYRLSTSAGSPHLIAPCLSMYSGQSMNIITASFNFPLSVNDPVCAAGGYRPLACIRDRASSLQAGAPNGALDTPGPWIGSHWPA